MWATVALAVGGSGLVALVLLVLFAFSVALGVGSDESGNLEWLLPLVALISVWAALPALWLSVRGIAGLFGVGSPSPETAHLSEERKEKELLGVLERRRELTPARAAIETSLSISEADRILGELAGKGYLATRVEEGALVYSLWDKDWQVPGDELRPENEE